MLRSSNYLSSALCSFALLLSLALAGGPARAEPPVANGPPDARQRPTEDARTVAERYVRLRVDDEQRPQALQTAIVRYQGLPGTAYAGRIVDLVGVVHIGEADYYRELDRRLAEYERVLYELVAPDGTRFKPEDLKDRGSIIGSLQTGMRDMLNLEYQLEKIDYMAENFRHADMSPEEFAEDFRRRGDSVWKMFARMMGAGLATQARSGGDAGLLLAMFSRDRPMRMKQSMARQLIDMDAVTAGMDDADGENTLIKGRNAKALRILREELDAGRNHVALFYGAGHLPDMAVQLERDFEMEEKRTQWLDAWDLTRN